MTEVVLKVEMMCMGCVSAVQRVLGKIEGIQSYTVNLEDQTVVVKGDVNPQDLLEKIAKTGKKTELVS